MKLEPTIAAEPAETWSVVTKMTLMDMLPLGLETQHLSGVDAEAIAFPEQERVRIHRTVAHQTMRDMTLEAQRDYTRAVVTKFGGSKLAAATAMKVSLATIYRYLNEGKSR